MRKTLLLAIVVMGCSSESASSAPSGPTAPNAPPPTTSATPPPNPCPPGTACIGIAAGADEHTIQSAFATATDGQTILFAAGTFHLTNTLIVAANHIDVRGAGIGQTVLDFSGQEAGSEGIFAENVSGLVVEQLTVRDTKGNAVKVLGGTDIALRKLETTWTAADKTTHGPYGLYPVQSKGVVIEDCVASQASDSGIYVGQSDGAVVRRNDVSFNVAGIEIENTFNAEVRDNTVHDNAGGILVFDLPGLPQKGGHAVTVHDNTIRANNTPNFAPSGAIVAQVPSGTGFVAMANTDVEAFANHFADNQTVHAAVISYLVTGLPISDAQYYPYPTRIDLHDNDFSGGGKKPDFSTQLGQLLATGLNNVFGGTDPDIVYDGIVDTARTGGPATDPMEICLRSNGTARFANLHLDEFDSSAPNLKAIATFDVQPYDCSLPTVPPPAVGSP